MKWSKVEPLFIQEPWLAYMMVWEGLRDLKKLKAHVETKVKHVAFRPFERLNPHWSSRFVTAKIETPDDWAKAIDEGKNYAEWMDGFSHGIRYVILYRFPKESHLREFLTEGRDRRTIHEALQEMKALFGDHGQGFGRFELDMVVRRMWASSERYGLLYECYDLFRIPEGFRLTPSGWTVLTKVK